MNVTRIAVTVVEYCALGLCLALPGAAAAQSYSSLSIPDNSSRISVQLKSSASRLPAGNQNFRILAVRVEFQEDDNLLTTGNGKFDYSRDSGAETDPPPHDRQYFLDHLEALRRYYDRVSKGKVVITSDLFPAGDEAAYLLPHRMDYYNPNTNEDELDRRLGELVRDAVTAADTDPLIDFSLYNAVVIFHAGVGSEFALEETALDPTPHDIPSAFLNLNDLRESVGDGLPGYQGIPVDGGTDFVSSALVLPETESKRGTEIGLLGMAAHQFGHYLGLPSLFNTVTGRPGIGKWGLMGVGFSNLNGVVPPEPCAWSKVYLGWETPVVVTTGTDFAVSASESPGGVRVYKVPITPSEYFLIENRQKDAAGDGLNGIQGTSGVVLEVDDYDTDIPGSGILIWHINERVIAAGLDDNTVNADKNRRGIDLEEADGSQDIGEEFPGLLPGFLSPENGLAVDAFFEGNNSEFTPETVPNSFSSNRANSHIFITGIGENGNTMRFSVERDWYIDGFPLYLGGDFADMAPIWLDPESADSVKLVIPSKDGAIFALNGSNEPFVDNGSTGIVTDSYGSAATVPVPLFITVGSGLPAAPAVRAAGPEPRTLDDRLVVATREPGIKIYALRDADNDGEGDLLAAWGLPVQVTSPVLLTNWITLGGGDAAVRFYGADGSPVSAVTAGTGIVTGFAAVERPGDGTVTFAVSSDGDMSEFNGIVLVSRSSLGFTAPYSPVALDERLTGGTQPFVTGPGGGMTTLESGSVMNNFGAEFSFAPVAGDVDGDGSREIVGVSGSTVYAFDPLNGVLTTGFPVDIRSLAYTGIISTEPVLGDITGDGRQNIIFGTTEGNVCALNADGSLVTGFPLPLEGRAVGSLTLLKNTQEDRMELAALDDAGYLSMWDLERPYGGAVIAWGTLGAGNAHLRHNTEALAEAPSVPAERLMPGEKVFNWPNPNIDNWTNIRYFLYHDADVRIRIFTQVGDLVAELSGPGTAGVDNEITWNLDGIESGVYLAEITARGSGLTERKVIKIAVIK